MARLAEFANGYVPKDSIIKTIAIVRHLIYAKPNAKSLSNANLGPISVLKYTAMIRNIDVVKVTINAKTNATLKTASSYALMNLATLIQKIMTVETSIFAK